MFLCRWNYIQTISKDCKRNLEAQRPAENTTNLQHHGSNLAHTFVDLSLSLWPVYLLSLALNQHLKVHFSWCFCCIHCVTHINSGPFNNFHPSSKTSRSRPNIEHLSRRCCQDLVQWFLWRRTWILDRRLPIEFLQMWADADGAGAAFWFPLGFCLFCLSALSRGGRQPAADGWFPLRTETPGSCSPVSTAWVTCDEHDSHKTRMSSSLPVYTGRASWSDFQQHSFTKQWVKANSFFFQRVHNFLHININWLIIYHFGLAREWKCSHEVVGCRYTVCCPHRKEGFIL